MFTDGGHALYLITLRGSVIVGPAHKDREEIAWVEKAVAGNEAAYRWLLGRYRDRVVRVASATLGGTSEAEDAAQEAFIKAFRTLPRLENKSSFYGWVCRIVVRVCLDQRRLKRSQYLPLLTDIPGQCCCDCASSAATTLLVWQILNELSPAMRAALVLRELDGLEYDEIGITLHIPVGTVRSRINAARAKFKKLWEEETKDLEGDYDVRY
jgi:RNA polymerase sigma-70 factor (ECF subfamily)